MEVDHYFTAAGLRLHGRLARRGDNLAVVVTHPHPLYGGSMANTVVDTIVAAYGRCGYTTLRFNFRGVGRSEGHFDDGLGEQEDLRQAVASLADLGFERIDLSGYSFGTWVAAHASLDHRISAMSMVAPPAAFMDFRPDLRLPRLSLVVTGGRDDFAPPALLRRLVPLWNPAARLEVIEGVDHFMVGCDDELLRRLVNGAAVACA
jgi:alpha/beta superfamily hydrolase